MKFIRSHNSIVELIDADKNGQIISSMGFNFGSLSFMISNKKVTLYTANPDKPFSSMVWSANIPLLIDDILYETEDEVSAAMGALMIDQYQLQLDKMKEKLEESDERAISAETRIEQKLDDEIERSQAEDERLEEFLISTSALVATFDTRIAEAEENAENAFSAVTEEVVRATAKDAEHDALLSSITYELSAETINRINADNLLQENLTNEVNRTISAETTLNNLIINEIDRATSAETVINDKVENEITRSVAKDAEHDALLSGITFELSAETLSRIAGDNLLQEQIDNERILRTSGDTILHNEIIAEVNRATSAETVINDKVENEITRSTAKDAEHDALISSITYDLSAETINRINADNLLQQNIDNEVLRATSAETIISNRLDAEIARATSAETIINDKVDNEITRSVAKDAEHDALLSGITYDLSAETLSRIAADNLLQENLTNEVNRATSAETMLHNEIIAEEARATSAETMLHEDIIYEINRATSAETALNEKIIEEKNRATSAETVLNNLIINEIDRATSAETILDEKITVVSGNVITISGNINTISATVETIISGDTFDYPIWKGTGTDSLKLNSSANTASNNYALAAGVSNQAKNTAAVAIGMGNVANGGFSVAEGRNTTANGIASHAGGSGTLASGTDSFALGTYAEAKNESEFASGKYNKSNTGSTDASKTIFSVGNGTSASDRRNAFEIMRNGDIYIQSGATDIRLQDYLGSGGTFDPTQYYKKTETSSKTEIADALNNYYKKSETSGKTELTTAFNAKQDVLIAGDNITIIDNVISASASGGSGITSAMCQTMIDRSISGKTNQSDFTAHTANTTVHITSTERTTWNGKANVWYGTQSQYDAITTKDPNTIYLVS